MHHNDLIEDEMYLTRNKYHVHTHVDKRMFVCIKSTLSNPCTWQKLRGILILVQICGHATTIPSVLYIVTTVKEMVESL